MMKQLFEAALASVQVGEDAAPEAKAALERVQAQIALVESAFKMLKSVRTDIEALRLDGGDYFEGTGDCEFGHEGVSIKIDWPNLAIDSDAIDTLLKSAEGASKALPVWFVLYGSEGEFFKASAEDRVHAMEQCANAYPGETVHVAVPDDGHGNLVLEVFGEDFVTCPKCGRRTEMGELPVQSMQIHVCHRCDHSFIAVPDDDDGDDELEGSILAKHQPCGCVVCTCEDEVQCQGCGAKHCGTHPVGQIPQPVFTGQTTKDAGDLAKRAAEVVADIAFTAGHLFATKLISVTDSRELMSNVTDWAYAFEAVFHPEWHSDLYMGLVDDYATYRLMGNHAAAEAMLKSMAVGEEVTA